MKTLLSVPPALSTLAPAGIADFLTHDPPDRKLGSGGGTAHLLHQAWRAEADALRFADWLAAEPRILLHAGGQSRRLPAYAPGGKALLPVPVFRWSTGQRLDQTLLDLQKPLLSELLERAPADLGFDADGIAVPLAALHRLNPAPEQLERALSGLLSDGLAELHPGGLRLPG